MSCVADHENHAALSTHAPHFFMHFSDEGTCGIKDAQPSLFGFSGNGFGYAVGRKNHRCTFWNIGKLIYKDGAAGAQAFNYRSVVYDFMAYVNRSAVDGERSLNDGNGAGNAGAKAARLRKKNLHVVKAWVCWVWE